MSKEIKELVRRYVDEVYTRGNIDQLDAFVTPNYVNHTEVQDVEGIEGLRQFAAAMREAMPDMEETIHDQVVEGDLEVHRYTITGSHQGTWLGIPPSGNPVALEGLTLARIENGKIAEEWSYTKTLMLMVQLGAIPPEMLSGG